MMKLVRGGKVDVKVYDHIGSHFQTFRGDGAGGPFSPFVVQYNC